MDEGCTWGRGEGAQAERLEHGHVLRPALKSLLFSVLAALETN